MVGLTIVRELERRGYDNIITRTHSQLDLTRQDKVEDFFAAERPEYVFLAAAKVGGIEANDKAPADFMYINMMLEMNVINAAWRNGCEKTGIPRLVVHISAHTPAAHARVLPPHLRT